jgi:DNA-binding MarR family transcriptional regulator/GNAT superfamily N-acetyltransferase
MYTASPSLHRTSASPDVIAAVRRFNRFYTRQIGLLHEGLLQSQFSLSEVRVLYEIAHRERSTAAELAKELELDPGYLSRMLRGFQVRGLVHKARSCADGRQRLLELTKKGGEVFAELDQRQTQEVAAMLRDTAQPEQLRLVAAMGSIEKVFHHDPGVSTRPYLLRTHQPGDMGWVIYRQGVLYWQEYGYDEHFEALVAEIAAKFIQQLDPKRERCWIAEREGENVGCIFLVRESKTVAKLRLLLVEPSARGLGIGKRLVSECVRFARHAGYKKITLWTQSELTVARRLYEEAGFELVKKGSHDSWSRRGLVAEVWDLKL